ncbi:hypothetical protein [Anaeromyxobacter diazotrophicus]|uniref:Uncharacterized protein n=1 Tax=Anaeromyxobacter diazotrophicus TaxID=2590199 RepID=A0A7I9VIZ6_9BACT|nr:hypothetical protein [Anaeromyxobacter diazotrophicus]GEJ56159.1 hypothetical protein AMYX_09000 [Anaeromyxobacter diazotrophicus]
MKHGVLALGLLCGACGGSEPKVVVGTGASPFTGVDAYAVASEVSGAALSADGSASAAFTGRSIEVVVSTAPGACARIGARTYKASTTTVAILVMNGAPVPISPGAYGVGNPRSGDPTPFAAVTSYTSDAACAGGTPRVSVSGAVTFSAIDAGEVSGSLDVVLDDGTRVTGSFGAPVCNAAEQNLAGVTFACTP